jgi:hypothetical protein
MFVGVAAVALLLATTMGLGQAQEPQGGMPREEPSIRSTADGYSIEASVARKFTYQGLLREDGTPVTGSQDMVFQLYSDDACTTTVGSDISMPGVEVVDGVFSVELPVGYFDVRGQGLWLGIRVEGVSVGCQEILPVPYALSLRPGAAIMGESPGGDALSVWNTASTGQSYGVYARSSSTFGYGVVSYATASSGDTYGVYARSSSPSGVGVFAAGIDAGADLVLGGNANTTLGDDGRIYSDPFYPSSDIHLIVNDGIRIDLDQDGDGEDADFEIRNKDDTLILNVDESGAFTIRNSANSVVFNVSANGTVTFGRAGIAAFPRPAYNSGWVTLGLGASVNRTHNLGGNTDNYVVDLTCKRSGGSGVNNWGVGGDANGDEYYGAWWSSLTTSSITLHRWTQDEDCPQVRVRIWVYP